MGDLRDQLKKAKLLSDKEARRLAHEERVRKKEVGREGLEQEQEQRRAELEQLREEERAKTREAQAEQDRLRQEAAEQAACLDLLQTEVVRPRGRGQRFYFQTTDGSLPWLEIDEATRFQLQSGHYWIVRTGPEGSHVYALLATEHAKRLEKTFPDRIAWSPGRRT